MQIHDLALLIHLALAPAPTEPPPPAAPPAASAPAAPAPEKKQAPEALSPAEAPDDPEVSSEVEEQSAEMEELKALEEVSLNPTAKPSAEVLQTIRRLGLGNPLRHQLEDAYGESELREDARPGELPQITDLAAFDVGLVKDEYDIPVEMQPLVAEYIQFFQGPGRKWFRNWMSRSTRFIPVMQPILEARGLPRDTVYLAMIESGFSSQATSWARAVGPWQFISETGRLMGLKQDFWVDERRDPLKSTEAAAKYLGELHDDLGHWYLAWAGYNTGGGRVRKLMEIKGSSDFWVLSDGKGFAKETRHYVPKLIACALVAKHYKAFGFTDDEFSFMPKMEYDEVKVPGPTDLEVIARAANTSVEAIHELNPELKRWCTPPATDQSPYVLRIPRGTRETFTANFPKLAPRERLAFKIHKVKRGDTISKIALTYHSAPEAILQFNRLRNVRALKVNTELAIPVPGARALKSGVADAALERQVASARRNGFVASRPEEEIPAGTPTHKGKVVPTGTLATRQVNGKTQITYAVKDGDSLWTIGQQFNCSVDELCRWNDLPRRGRGLKVGTVLTIWQGGEGTGAKAQGRSAPPLAKKEAPSVLAAVASGAKKTVHLLVAGETLWSVAQHYGVSVEDLKRWNGITNHRAIRAGQELTLLIR